ncbi:hypothetical protein AGABI2DRAFT_115703 [Agaricus bisporus var. bisporus H97]|uniref:hypothetical protein n=1 Tax=Agaricus bisporus var. bisporus (strain H97 / ATCC MYA-4626 / FGSC 10389) TaxID=936046 RepID=UPI00029F7F54|nr:hypothetical protein AGABI2DRAFT_115703 [Agaricus bisporus var. bisporus H97]EKV50629.1 hypothetical protein AGABI2DRAFT_115703 [Agaricus bisporus var. bisporus H97]
MLSSLNGFLDTSPSIIQVISILGTAYGAIQYIEAKRSPLNAIPTVGYSGVITSYITAIRWLLNGSELIREGSDKYPNRVFKIAAMFKWVIVLNGEQYVDDIRNASDDVLSFVEAIEETTHTKYVLGPVAEHPHHVVTLRSNVTRNIATKSDEIRDEVRAALHDLIPATEGPPHVNPLIGVYSQNDRLDTSSEFPSVSVGPDSYAGIISKRLAGRDPGYCAAMEKYLVDVLISAKIIDCFPELFRPLVGNYVTPVAKTMKQVMKYLAPTVQERIARYEQYGKDDTERPLALGDGDGRLSPHSPRYYQSNFTPKLCGYAHYYNGKLISLKVFTQTMYDLAVHPEYLDDLREEVEGAIREHGWSKVAIQKLRKLDSFIKESLRVNPTSSLVLLRKTLQNWTTTDGTLIPAGSFLGVAGSATQSKNAFEDAHEFKGFRFAEMRDRDEGLDSMKHQMVSLDAEHIIFGYGRHACPGRFFAVHEIKIMLAQIILEYDVQMENGSMDRPPSLSFESNDVPNPKAKMRFRKRQMD